MMPLTLVSVGEKSLIRKVGGTAEIKKHLNNLGFVEGSFVTVMTSFAGNLIVNVKETRIAISSEMAQRILVS